MFIFERRANMELGSVLALQLESSNDLGHPLSLSDNSSSVQNALNITPELTRVNATTEYELDEFVLGALQSKILIALLISKTGNLSSGMITKKAGISASSWAKIKLNMIDQGLLICTHRREMSEGRVIGSVEVKLTRRGILVAQNLLLIAGLMGKTPTELESQMEASPRNMVQLAAPIVPSA